MTARDVHLPVAAQSSLDAIVDVGRRAAAAGYDRLWMPETWGRDAVSVLAILAARVDDVGLGTSVLNVYSRSPALLGQTAVTLDEACGGRFRLGIGPSGPALIEGWHGVDYDRPLRRTREAAEIARAVATGEVVAYDGEIFDLDGFRLRCEPPADPVPIDLAGLGPKAVELAGFIGDGWHALFVTPDGLERRLEALAVGLEKADRRREEVRVTVGVPCCALEDDERARTLVREHIAFYLGSMGPFYRRALAAQGHADAVERIVDAWRAGDRQDALAAIDDDLLAQLAAAGDGATARSALDAFADLPGVDAVAVSFPRGADGAEIAATVDALAP